jgi:DUF4097 and DUF4098 domain-containing protein YvlB
MGLAQDFQHSYTISSSSGQIFIDTVSGNIKVQGYKGDKIEILAFKRGSDANAIEIQDHSSGDVINLRAWPRSLQSDPGKIPQGKFPAGGFDPGKIPQGKLPPGGFDPGRFPQAKSPPGGFDPGRFDVGDNSVDFEIRVPKSVNYNFNWLHSYRGNVEISNVSGRIIAGSRRGNVDVKDVRGFIRCDAFIGSTQVELGSHKDANDMKFSSMSGNIVVKAPGNLDAEIYMSSESGQVKTDYPIEVQKMRYGHRLFAQAKLGMGRQKLTITSVSGSISLLKK